MNQIKESMDFSGVGISLLKPEHAIEFVCRATSLDTSLQKDCNIKTGKHIMHTTLQSLADTADILLFCLQDTEQFNLSFQNIPLMITEDCIVRTAPATGFVLLEAREDFCEFFPSKRKAFLHSTIAKVLSNYISDKVEIFRGKVKRFKLSDFVTLVKETNEIEHTCTCLKLWNKMNPTEAWIRLFWEFFSYQLPKEDDHTVSQQLQIMKHLPLIPVVKSSSSDLYLAPPSIINRLIDLHSFSTNHVLHIALIRMNLPHVCKSAFSESGDSKSFNLLAKQVSNFNTPTAVLECLDLNICEKTVSDLTDEQIQSVLQYFNDCLDENVSPGALEKLKNIPLFLSHFGKRIALKRYKTVHVVPYHLPTEGLEDLAVKADVLFLRNTGHGKLFTRLNIKELSLGQVYTTYIVPQQHLLHRVCFYRHLEFLSRHIYDEKFDNMASLLSVLQKTPFVETNERGMVRVCDLFDPEHVVFGQMCEKCELVPDLLPDRYKQSNILRLFRKLGLKTKMTVALFERFARDIAARSESESLSEIVCANSKTLAIQLFSMDDEFFVKGTFDNLAKIKFITPHIVGKALSSIKQQFNSDKLICFEGAILNTSENISWTVSDILPMHADPILQRRSKSQIIQKKLKVCQTPSIDVFVCHCRRIGESLDKILSTLNELSRSRLFAIMNDIYNAFSEFAKNDQITDESMISLANVPIIYYPKTKLIVAAKRVVIACRSEEEIPPYLLKYPDSYTRHTDVFLRLGATKEPTCESFACVLQSLKAETLKTGEPEVLPNEYAYAMKAMGHLFKYLSNETHVAKLSCGKLILLSENNTLEDARILIVSNNSYFRQKLDKSATAHCKYLIKFDQFQEYRLKSEDCVANLQHLSLAHRPHLLTEVVKERVVLENITIKDKKISSLIEESIHGYDFLYGFLRLYRHVLDSRNKNWDSKDETRISNCLKNITFKQCSGIETVLYLTQIENGQLGGEILIENTNAVRRIHTEKNEDNVCIYFDTSIANWKQNVRRNIAVHLNELVDECFDTTTSFLLMEIVGMFETPHEIELYLSQERIKEYTFEPTAISESTSYPIPGEIVPKKFHRYLDNDYGIIYEHDYKFIALEVDDPAFDEEESEEEDMECSDKEMEPTYKYVHITRKIGPENELPLLQEYEVDCGNETKLVVPAFQLYKFVRKEKKNDENGTEIVIYTRDSGEQNDELPTAQTTPKSLKEVFCEIRTYLKEAWKNEDHKRKLIIKRLMFKWHPDKNPANESFCTKVFQYIQQCLSLLERGLDLMEEEDEDINSGMNRSNPNSGGGNRSYPGSYGNTRYDRYWRRYERGRRYNESSYNNDSNNHGSRRASGRYNNFHFNWWSGGSYTHSKYEPYHWYSRARLWFKQAEYDLRHAKECMRQSDYSQFNWPCYNAHQATEKALKAAWYAKDANKITRVMTSHNLEFIARDLGSSIQTLAKRLSDITGGNKAMRYPRTWPSQQVPAEAYSKDTAKAVLDVAQEILTLVHSNYIK